MDKEDRNKLLSTYSPQTQKDLGLKNQPLTELNDLKITRIKRIMV